MSSDIDTTAEKSLVDHASQLSLAMLTIASSEPATRDRIKEILDATAKHDAARQEADQSIKLAAEHGRLIDGKLVELSRRETELAQETTREESRRLKADQDLRDGAADLDRRKAALDQAEKRVSGLIEQHEKFTGHARNYLKMIEAVRS